MNKYFNYKIVKDFVFFSVFLLLLTLFSCVSSQKETSIPTEFQNKPITQVGPINNPRYFGKQFLDDTLVEKIVVEGRSQIFASGEQAAFESALNHALRNAVEIVLGSMVDNRTLVNNGVLIEDKIYSRSYGFVKTYEILSENKKADTLFLKVRATVVIGDVRDYAMALGILQDRAQRPIIAVLVDENIDGQFTSYFKTALEEKLINKQFEIVHQEQMSVVLKKINSSLEEISRDSKPEIEAGIESGAQIIIRGKVDAVKNDLSKNPLFKDKNLKSINVSVEVEGYNLGDARLLSVRQMRDNGIGLDETTALKNGLEKIVDKLGDKLIDDLIKKWDLHINNGFEYTVVISGVEYKDTTFIRSQIPRRLQGIKAVFDRGYDKNLMNLLIRFQGPAEELVRSLLVKLKPEIDLELKSYDQSKVIFYAK